MAVQPPDRSRLTLDIHGLPIEVVGDDVVGTFRTELGYFEVGTDGPNPDLVVRPDPDDRMKSIRPKGMRQGLRIDDHGGAVNVLYDVGLPSSHLVAWCESLLRWPGKVLVHASGVVEDHAASVFLAGPKTGKTTTVIDLLRDGYDFLGDDGVILSDGEALPYPKPIRLYDHNLSGDRALCKGVSPWGGGLHALMKTSHFLRERVRPHIPSRGARYALETYLDRMVRRAEVTDIHPSCRVADPCPLRDAIWMHRCDATSFRSERVELEDIVNRIQQSVFHERAPYWAQLALDGAQRGDPVDVRAWMSQDRRTLLDCLGDARRWVLSIPRHAGPQDVTARLKELIGR